MNIAYCEDEKIQLEYMEQLIKSGQTKGMTLLHILAMAVRRSCCLSIRTVSRSICSFWILIWTAWMAWRSQRRSGKRSKTSHRFLTNRSEYVFEGYEVGALRYLLKPVEETKLFSLLDEISYALGKERRYLIENVGGETVKIPVDTIYSVEAKGHYIRLHTSVGDYEYKKNLSEIAEELAKDQPGQKTEFISTHRSF